MQYHPEVLHSEQGQEVLAPLLALGAPAVARVGPMPYLALQQLIDGANLHGMRNYWSADFYGELKSLLGPNCLT